MKAKAIEMGWKMPKRFVLYQGSHKGQSIEYVVLGESKEDVRARYGVRHWQVRKYGRSGDEKLPELRDTAALRL